jgi:hypothetical protein
MTPAARNRALIIWAIAFAVLPVSLAALVLLADQIAAAGCTAVGIWCR